MIDLCSACNAVSYLNHKFGISGPAASQLLVFLKWKRHQSFLYLSRVGYSGNSRLFELVDTVNLFTVMFLTFTWIFFQESLNFMFELWFIQDPCRRFRYLF